MSREDTTYDDDDVFDVASSDEDFEIEIDAKEIIASRDTSPIAKRRMVEAKLEERRLRKQIEDDFDFGDD